MSVVSVHSTLNFRSLMHKSRADLAHMVLDFGSQLERLQKELEVERNTNVHLKASIREGV
jgi:hypothetical protein